MSKTMAKVTDEMALKMITELAEMLCDGHVTIMKFTTNWRVSFGNQEYTTRDEIEKMPVGDTLAEALTIAIESSNAHGKRRAKSRCKTTS